MPLQRPREETPYEFGVAAEAGKHCESESESETETESGGPPEEEKQSDEESDVDTETEVGAQMAQFCPPPIETMRRADDAQEGAEAQGGHPQPRDPSQSQREL